MTSNSLLDVKAIAFDFDDTICLNHGYSLIIENEAASLLGGSPISPEVYNKTTGVQLRQACTIRYPGVDPDKFMEVFVQVFNKYYQQGKIDIITPSTINVFKHLQDLGYKIAIVTSRNLTISSHLKISSFPLFPYIDYFQDYEDWPYSKPDPRVFDNLLKIYNLAPQQLLYVGDSITDAQAANGANIPFIVTLESQNRTVFDFQNFQVHAYLNRLSDIINYVG